MCQGLGPKQHDETSAIDRSTNIINNCTYDYTYNNTNYTNSSFTNSTGAALALDLNITAITFGKYI